MKKSKTKANETQDEKSNTHDMYRLYCGDTIIYQGDLDNLEEKLYQHDKNQNLWCSIYRVYLGSDVIFQGGSEELLRKLRAIENKEK
jgi:hypothetical protein